jgi:hypothetical protein
MNLGQHTFTVVVTPDSINDDVNQFVAIGAIRKGGLAKLNAAASARAAGDCATANNHYLAFIKELQAQIGKGVDAAAVMIMITDAQSVPTCLARH